MSYKQLAKNVLEKRKGFLTLSASTNNRFNFLDTGLFTFVDAGQGRPNLHYKINSVPERFVLNVCDFQVYNYISSSLLHFPTHTHVRRGSVSENFKFLFSTFISRVFSLPHANAAYTSRQLL